MAQKKVSKIQEKGRGRKQCPQCKIFLGVRTTDCECGYVFEVKKGEQKNKTNTISQFKIPESYKDKVIENIVLYPTKEAQIPKKLKKNAGIKDIIKWANETRDHFIENNKEFLVNSALINLSKRMENVNHQAIENVITDNVQDVIYNGE